MVLGADRCGRGVARDRQAGNTGSLAYTLSLLRLVAELESEEPARLEAFDGLSNSVSSS